MIGRRHQAAMPEKDLNSVTARDHRISSYKLGTRLWLTPKEKSAELIARVRRIAGRSEEHTSELQSLMRISYAVFCLKKKIILYHVILYYIQNSAHTTNHI